jgi:hypothetical protein
MNKSVFDGVWVRVLEEDRVIIDFHVFCIFTIDTDVCVPCLRVVIDKTVTNDFAGMSAIA